jgi:hypothetical protein
MSMCETVAVRAKRMQDCLTCLLSVTPSVVKAFRWLTMQTYVTGVYLAVGTGDKHKYCFGGACLADSAEMGVIGMHVQKCTYINSWICLNWTIRIRTHSCPLTLWTANLVWHNSRTFLFLQCRPVWTVQPYTALCRRERRAHFFLTAWIQANKAKQYCSGENAMIIPRPSQP